MKLLSESLQEVAGSQLKTLLSKMTHSRPMGIFSGIAITCMVQSSSITTVMVVGFVNAGLLKLSRAITVIMGSNIGTTITAWMVALLGFKFKITIFALPSIFFGMVFVFLSQKKLKFYGLILIGFGLLFLGLDFMKSAIPDATKNPESFQFLQSYVRNDFYTVLTFLLVGIILTVIIQSSSATTTITIALTFSGHITLEAAFGMLLGENIGTTITANIATLVGGIQSKRAALAHTIFNLIGVTWALCLFDPMVQIVAFLVNSNPLQDTESTRFHISTFHSMFNVLNTLLLVGFVGQLEKIVIKISSLFSEEQPQEIFKGTKLLKAGGSSMGASLELEQILGFSRIFIRKTIKNFINIEKLVLKKYSPKIVKSVLEVETTLDNYRYNVLSALNIIQEEGLIGRTAKQVISFAETVKKAEEIGDCFARIARRTGLAHDNETQLGKKEKGVLKEQVALINQQIKILRKCLKEGPSQEAKFKAKNLRSKIQRKFYSLEKKVNQKKMNRVSNWLPLMFAVDLSRDFDITSKCLDDVINLYLVI